MSAAVNATSKQRDRPVRVLLVDDDPLFCRIFSSYARRHNVDLRFFYSPRDAYHQMPDIDYDVAVIDYYLGIVKGPQLCNYLDRLGKRKPIIMVTAQGSTIPPENTSLIVKDVLSKSMGIPAILDRVRLAHIMGT